MRFEHETLSQRVLFGTGAAATHLVAEVARLGARRVMVIAAESEAAIAATLIEGIDVALVYTDVAPHVPIEKAEAARKAAAQVDADLLVCIGGGSTTGLAKAIAMVHAVPIVAIPTTYAGSEATNVWGLTEAARKTTGVDNAVLPVTVIYDAELTLSLPVELSVASGLNALAHCVDSMWAPRADPINQALAIEGVHALSWGLRLVVMDPEGTVGRERVLYGAYLAAVAFASAGSGMHHKICHVLGGAFGLPHAQTHATILPHVLAFNSAAVPDIEQRLADAFGSVTATVGLDKLRADTGAPTALRDYGFTEADIPEAVQLILPNIPASNPRPVTADNLETLLRAALVGAAAGQ
ncbi:maleylacetate reductase [Nocardia sp. NPDC050175]|uniref:maleylacetate reductase n=1 Tax=Nocardia sp. NPDC050175 TaxID=3364317 RepID=UPI003788221E